MKKDQRDTLYIIGNGFDLFHGLDTFYSSFGLFLKDYYPPTYEYFVNYFGLPDLDINNKDSLHNVLWSNFESSLALLDIELVLSEHIEFRANPLSDTFSTGDFYTIEVYVEEIKEDLTVKMLEIFKEFILNVDFPEIENNRLLNINKDALFFNFNYTDTLEKYYQIQQNQILYIHNKADSDDKLILGHGINPRDFQRDEAIPPVGLDEDELDQWRQVQANNYDLSIERGREKLIEYFRESFKKTSQIIERNINFFQSLHSIKRVYVLGHSLADVDSEYFKMIVNSIDKDVIWYISYYKTEEIASRIEKMMSFGLSKSQVKLLKINEI